MLQGGEAGAIKAGSDTVLKPGELTAISGLGALVIQNLGCGVALFVWDPAIDVAGAANILLGDQMVASQASILTARNAVEEIVDRMVKLGAVESRVQAAIVGGASGLRNPEVTDAVLEFGARNILAVDRALEGVGIPCMARDVGGSSGRTASLCFRSGDIKVKAGPMPERILWRMGVA